MAERDSKGFLAIVSPCSQCKNQRAYPDDKGGKQTYCPRRRWIDQVGKLQANNQDVTGLEHLVLTGKGPLSGGTLNPFKTFEGAGSANDLLNPVIDREHKSILVWIARLVDNQTVTDPKSGDIVKPNLLDPSFIPDFTDDIVCDTLPYVPEDDEFSYFSRGTFEEGQSVLLTGTNQQVDLETGTTTRIGGTCKRTSLLNFVPSNRHKEHHSPEGT